MLRDFSAHFFTLLRCATGKIGKNQEPAAAAAAALQCSAKDKRCCKDSQRFVGLAKELGQAEAGVRGGEGGGAGLGLGAVKSLHTCSWATC